jgi:hypothetical protein
VGGFNLGVGDQIAFLTANSGVSGTFGTVENDFVTGNIVNGEVFYLPNAVILASTQASVQEQMSPGEFTSIFVAANTVAYLRALIWRSEWATFTRAATASTRRV